MQDSMDLPSQSEIQQHLSFPLQQIISPKGRRLSKNPFNNTASQQSLAYSNSTYQKNQYTERSPPFFTNLQNLSNQNINTLNLKSFDHKKESTFGSNRGLVIQFQKIKQQQSMNSFDNSQNLTKQRIQLPYFLSNQNSPQQVYLSKNNSKRQIDYIQNKHQINYLQDKHQINYLQKQHKTNYPQKNNSKHQIKIEDQENNQINSENDSFDQKQQIQQNIVTNKKYYKINPQSKNVLKERSNDKIKAEFNKSDSIFQNSTNKSKSSKNQKSNINETNKKNKINTKNTISQHNKSPLNRQTNKSPFNRQISKSPFNRQTSKSPYNRQYNKSCWKKQDNYKDQNLGLKQRIKQLQYGLHVESISTEQLRTKVNVLNELLQQKFLQKNGINFKLFKNSAKSKLNQKSAQLEGNYNNIDLYVQMKKLQKQKQELQICLQHAIQECQIAAKSPFLLKNEGAQKSQNQIKTQTSFSFSPNQLKTKKYNTIVTSSQMIESEQTQTIIQYVQSQKQIIKRKDSKIQELTIVNKELFLKLDSINQQLKKMQTNQQRFIHQQRPKLIQQINQLTRQISNKNQQLNSKNQQIRSKDQQIRNKDQQIRQQIRTKNQQVLKLQTQNQQIVRQQMQNNLWQLKQHQISSNSKNISNIQINSQMKNSQSPFKILQAYKNKSDIRKLERNSDIAPDALSLMLMQQEELRLLKNERDYFKNQFQHAKNVKQQNFRLQILNQRLNNQLQSLYTLLQAQQTQ